MLLPSLEQKSEKPIKVPEIVVKDVRHSDQDTTSYTAERVNTATRTDTPLIQVPQSVEVVTQKVIQDQRAVRVEQALRNVSGVALGDVGQSGIAADVAYCRGFPCGYFKNYLRNEDQNQVLTFRDIANIQRLEVLKGPASVLYGRSQPGGIINILTKQPQAERYASIDQIIGNYNSYRTMIDVTGPLNESKTLLFRINGAYENMESFRDVVRGQRYFVAPSSPGLSATIRPLQSRENTSEIAGLRTSVFQRSDGDWPPSRTAVFWASGSIPSRLRRAEPESRLTIVSTATGGSRAD